MELKLETLEQAIDRLAREPLRKGFKLEGIYHYTDDKGAVLFHRIRLKHPDGEKWIRPIFKNGSGYVLKEPKFENGKPLYNLSKLRQPDVGSLYVVEGEPKVDLLTELGFIATTSGSAASANTADWTPLADRLVIIWRDYDKVGLAYAKIVTAILESLGCAVKWIDVDQLNLKESDDIIDWLQLHPNVSKSDIENLPTIDPQSQSKKEIHNQQSSKNSVPILEQEVRHGLIGEFLDVVEPGCEADPAALLFQFLTIAGNIIGRNPYFEITRDHHHPNMFIVLVGQSCHSRKGVSLNLCLSLFAEAFQEWSQYCLKSGLSSGEGLIYHVRDKITETDSDHVETIKDPGVEDKRLLIKETEFGGTLKILQRSGNTLSPVLRDAFDGQDLSLLTKNNPIKATKPHISIIAHITKAELLKELSSIEMANGFANRFLWIFVKRSKSLPLGGNIDPDALKNITKKVAEAVQFSRGVSQLKFSMDVEAIYTNIYDSLTEESAGVAAAMTARGAPYIIRISCIYALLDHSKKIEKEHLMAAIAAWHYCEQSVYYLFGGTLGEKAADGLLAKLKATTIGMSRTEIRDFFNRNKSEAEIVKVLQFLEGLELVRCERVNPDENNKGRSTEKWHAV